MSELRRASELRDHDLTVIDGKNVMVTWTVGLGKHEIRVGYVPDKGGSEEYVDLARTGRYPYRGRA